MCIPPTWGMYYQIIYNFLKIASPNKKICLSINPLASYPYKIKELFKKHYKISSGYVSEDTIYALTSSDESVSKLALDIITSFTLGTVCLDYRLLLGFILYEKFVSLKSKPRFTNLIELKHSMYFVVYDIHNLRLQFMEKYIRGSIPKKFNSIIKDILDYEEI